jgi:ABC-type polysaccharide/polyol phosphate transport system ATPase subunit
MNSENNIVIEFKNVTKQFSKQNQKTFKEFLPALIKGEQTTESFTALDDISFKIKKGETVGIIGPNGSGKSTILKLIAGVMTPNKGEVIIKGKISPLIELGAGFHPELTGRENIYLNGAILGLKRKEIDKNLQSIIDFSELQEFVDQPVKHYSSGMYMRLAFAVAIHVNPEILLVDEILAVGDTAFQAKCFAKMEEYKKDASKTIIIVSHDLNSIEKMCDKVMLIEHGQMKIFNNTERVIYEYLKKINEKNEKHYTKDKFEMSEVSLEQNERRWGNFNIEINEVNILNSNNKNQNVFSNDQDIIIEVNCKTKTTQQNVNLAIAIFDEKTGNCIFATNTEIDGIKIPKLNKDFKFYYKIHKNYLLNGEYLLQIGIFGDYNQKTFDFIDKCYKFKVNKTSQKEIGLTKIPHTWIIK